jgi:hypothetical protein
VEDAPGNEDCEIEGGGANDRFEEGGGGKVGGGSYADY